MARSRYSTVAIVLHWTIAVLLAGQIAGGFYMTGMPDEEASAKFQLYQLHKSFGVTVLLLTLVRLAWRFWHKPPPLPENTPRWQSLAARGLHWVFYALLLAIPLAGWAYVSVAPFNVPTVLFGALPWPHLSFLVDLGDRETLAEGFMGAHEALAKATIALVGLHVAAALKHHFIDRDDVLAHMAPFARRKGLK